MPGKRSGEEQGPLRRPIAWLPCLYAMAIVAAASAEPTGPVPPVATIMARMAEARALNRARFRPYVVTRDYELFGRERDRTKSRVTSDVAFVPPDSKQYTIRRSSGAGLGERVVRRMLESEAEITRQHSATDLSDANYAVRFVREEDDAGVRCYLLELLPRRKDHNLLRGRVWVDATTYLVRRSEGEPAKSPSWWLRDVRIAFRYGEVGGMWLQTASEVTVNVRIVGPHTMVSRDVKYQIDGAAAVEAPQ